MRKYLATAFSDRSLKDQEPLVQEVVDQLITKLAEHGSKPGGTNMVMWFDLATFDVCGICCQFAAVCCANRVS
jgi:cytochrome P450